MSDIGYGQEMCAFFIMLRTNDIQTISFEYSCNNCYLVRLPIENEGTDERHLLQVGTQEDGNKRVMGCGEVNVCIYI